MPRMPGIQLADPEIREQLSSSDRLAIARTLGENLAYIQKAKWPICGRYQVATGTVEPFELKQELAWPFPVESDPHLVTLLPTPTSYAQRVLACLRNLLRRAQVVNGSATTQEDIVWAENYIEEAQDALNEAFEPCLVLEDYKSENLVVLQQGDEWKVSGIFDLMAQVLLQSYLNQTSPRPGFMQRFPVYMLLDRAIIWEFIHRHEPHWWDGKHTLRDWASPYLFLEES